jgi:hypothetical protein
MKSVFRLAATAAAAMVVSQAQAATTVHTDLTSFLAAVAGGAYAETFSGTEDTSFAGGGYSYTVSAPDGTYASGSDLGTNQAEQALTITFTGSPVSAVGGNFYATDINPDFQPEIITVTLSNGDGASFLPASKSSFVGFTTSAPITSLTVSFYDPNWFGRYATVDNLTVGMNAALVPEPGQWALMAMGLAGLALLKRRSAV